MIVLILLPFLLQVFVMVVDEFYFHYKRGLPRWERIGHPLDTLTVLVCFGWIFFQPLSVIAAQVYLAMALFSTLFVTKDEWVHNRFCLPGENWLHALLFILHPLVLIAAFLIWPSLHPDHGQVLSLSLPTSSSLAVFFKIQLSLMVLYGSYQFVYWNFLWREPMKSTTPSTIP